MMRSFHSTYGIFLSVVLLASLPAGSEASPVEVSSFAGTIGGFNITPNGNGTDTMSFQSSSVTQINGSMISPSLTASFSNFTLNTTPTSTTSMGTNYSVSAGTMSFSNGTQHVNFNISKFNLTVLNHTTNIAVLSDTLQLTGTNTVLNNYNFNNFGSGSGNQGILSGSLVAVPTGTNLNSVIQGDQDPLGTGSFAGGLTPLVTNVPEPASLLLWGAVGVGGVWYSRRRLQGKLAM